MKEASIRNAKSSLTSLLREVEKGRAIRLTRRGKPVAVLLSERQYERMTAKAIGAHSRMHKTKVSRAVAALEAKGLAVRAANAEDLRESFLALSGRGRRLYAELAPRALAFERALDAALGARERRHLDALLHSLEARARELDGDPDWR